eukprot:289990-Hanusia_phi.AAC.1
MTSWQSYHDDHSKEVDEEMKEAKIAHLKRQLAISECEIERLQSVNVRLSMQIRETQNLLWNNVSDESILSQLLELQSFIWDADVENTLQAKERLLDAAGFSNILLVELKQIQDGVLALSDSVELLSEENARMSGRMILLDQEKAQMQDELERFKKMADEERVALLQKLQSFKENFGASVAFQDLDEHSVDLGRDHDTGIPLLEEYSMVSHSQLDTSAGAEIAGETSSSDGEFVPVGYLAEKYVDFQASTLLNTNLLNTHEDAPVKPLPGSDPHSGMPKFLLEAGLTTASESVPPAFTEQVRIHIDQILDLIRECNSDVMQIKRLQGMTEEIQKTRTLFACDRSQEQPNMFNSRNLERDNMDQFPSLRISQVTSYIEYHSHRRCMDSKPLMKSSKNVISNPRSFRKNSKRC